MTDSVSHKNTSAGTNTQPLGKATSESNTIEVAVDNHDNGLLSTLPITPIRNSPSGTIYHKLLQGSFLDYWWKAIIACIFMVCALMAIILILALHQDRPLPNWPLTITINSLVSIMVVILKSSMLAIVASGLAQTKWLWFEKPRPLSQYSTYDKASVGPPEAAQLLWILRGQQIIASAAALVVILAVAIDPFTQQIIQYYESIAPSDVRGNATIPRTNHYEDAGPHIGAGENNIDNDMLGAVMAGFWGAGTGSGSYTVEATNCLTGNCTFAEEYHTLAMCSSCTDLTSQLVRVNYTTYMELLNFTLPSGTTLTSGGSSTENQWMVANSSYAFTTQPAAASAIAGRDFIWSNYTGSGVFAASCFIYPCINTYTANVTDGILTENLVNSVPVPYNETVGPECWTALRKDCLNTTDWALLATQGVYPTDAPGADYLPYCADNYVNITGSCVYDFDFISDNAYRYFFDYALDFNKGRFLDGSLVGDSANEAIGPDDIIYLYDSGYANFSRINETWQSIAGTMSANIRAMNETSFGSTWGVPAQGAVLYTQTLIGVDWRWLILPLFLVALTLLFFIAVIIQTNVNGRHPFGKTFSLSLLFTGVAGQVEEQIPGLPDGLFKEKKEEGKGEAEGEQNIAEETKVEEKKVLIQMTRTEDGAWKLSVI
ncbi:hypothetical protein N431DRAFT_563141 [Stipitochalara longipes BDJ]|nr:hypothetical protein N431DRAFT_563141 [Stipitochalara longipes BDJ]